MLMNGHKAGATACPNCSITVDALEIAAVLLGRLAAPIAAATHLLGERLRSEVEKFPFDPAGNTLEPCRTYLAGFIENALTHRRFPIGLTRTGLRVDAFFAEEWRSNQSSILTEY